MRKDIALYIGDSMVEFSEPPQILYNYTETEITNPTVVKNSYSKTLTIIGTPSNNALFGHYWNLERYQIAGVGNVKIGSYFNPLEKVPFTIYINSEIYESGYCKLDSIRKNGNSVEYTVSLFGGLGSFFYSLSYSKDNEGNVEGPDKLSIADLYYGDNIDLDFTINKDAVWDAWNQLSGNTNSVETEDDADRPNNYLYDEKWNIINFAPCYNGVPSDFDSTKVLVNCSGISSGFTTSYTESGTNYTTRDGYTIGETTDSLTEWMTFDLRSYFQRPIINIRKIFEACCNPKNNGGYEVQLDSHFFHSDNPYWTDTWMTLPMLKDADITKEEEEEVSGISFTPIEGTTNLSLSFNSGVGTYNNLNINFIPTFSADTSTMRIPVGFLSHYYTNPNATTTVSRDFCKYVKYFSAVIFQAVAYNSDDEEVGKSDIFYLITTPPSSANMSSDFKIFKDDWVAAGGSTKDKVNTYTGHFVYDSTNNVFRWANDNGVLQGFTFKLQSSADFDRVIIRMIMPYSLEYQMINGNYYNYVGEEHKGNGASAYCSTVVANMDFSGYTEALNYDKVGGSFSMIDGGGSTVLITDYGSFFSNTKIPFKELISDAKTPCDFMLDYCKMFGLYFYKDGSEESTDSACTSGVIHIMDRNTFFKRDEIQNIEDIIDRGKDITITPQMADKKWYDFSTPQIESDLNEKYLSKYGVNYANKRINTGYNFNSEINELYSSSMYNSGIMTLEADRYFNRPNEYGLPVFINNSFTHNLYNGSDIKEITEPIRAINTDPLNSDNLTNYDEFEKLQCHKADNEASDGSNVLLFYNGAVDGDVDYWISDDIQAMAQLNDNNPCWLITKSEKNIGGVYIAYKFQSLPMFSRYKKLEDGTITHSLDMGSSSETYIPNTYFKSDNDIYSKCWRDYISDMYNVNTRQLDCYCLLETRPNPEWLRRFYWFDNALWRLNKIVDWNISSLDTTKMEFIKVQDIDDFKVEKIVNNKEQKKSALSFTNSAMTISYEAQDVNMSYEAENIIDSSYTYSYDEDLIEMISNDKNNKVLTATFKENGYTDRNTTITMNAVDVYEEEKSASISITQTAQSNRELTITPSALTASSAASSYTLNIVFRGREENEMLSITPSTSYISSIVQTYDSSTSENGTITFNISENTIGSDERNMTLTMSASDLNVVYNITQVRGNSECSLLTEDKESHINGIGKSGGTYTLKAKSVLNWTLTCSASTESVSSFFNVRPSSGTSGETDVVLTVLQNNEEYRYGYIIMSNGKTSVNFGISQYNY